MTNEAIDPIFLAEFRAEANHHLATIEAAVVAADGSSESAPSVDLLFRSFHSVKGLARVLGDAALEAVNHAAESLLGAVRAGRRQLDSDIQDALIAALDENRNLMTTIGRDRAANPNLIARLSALADDAEGPAAADKQAAQNPFEPWRLLTDDEDLLVALIELAEEIMPQIAARLFEPAPLDADDLATLVHAFGRLHLSGLARDVMRLGQARQNDRVACFAELLADVQRLARLAGRPAIIALAPETLAAVQAMAASDVAGDDVGELLQQQQLQLPAGLLEAGAAVRSAFIGREPPAGLAEAFLVPEGGEPPLQSLLNRLAGEDAILAAQHHVADGTAGLAVLFDPGSDDATRYLAGLELPARASGIAGVSAQTPTRLFAPVAASVPAQEETQVRVPIEVLDKLFGRVGEFFSIGSWLNVLVFDSGMQDVIGRLSDHAVTKAPEISADIEKLARYHRDVSSIEAEVNRLVSLIHESTLGLRVIPLESLVARFPRMIRDTARETGKTVRFESQTNGIKIDKGMSEMLADPLMHMLRNAVDHGLESPEVRLAQGKSVPASLRLDAVQTGNRIHLTIADDGRGIDVEAVRRKAVALRLVSEEESLRLSPQQVARFIFAAGFSTSQSVSTVSGRGVGMDVVLVNITKLGGRVDIETEPGAGTIFHLDMPLSAAIQPMLLVETVVQTIGFPEAMVSEVTSVAFSEIQIVNGQRSILLHGRFLPIFQLTDLLRLPTRPTAQPDFLSLVVCEWDGRRIGIEIHRILRRHEMLIRETHPRITQLPGIGGVTTLGFDRIVLVVDPDDLFEIARRTATRGVQTAISRLTSQVQA